MTPDQVAAIADTQYSGDEYSYDNLAERLFALLVDVAWAYELQLRRADGRVALSDDPTTVPVSMAFLAGFTPRDVLVQGLRENLEMREEDPATPGPDA
jgi:hypothetical protein